MVRRAVEVAHAHVPDAEGHEVGLVARVGVEPHVVGRVVDVDAVEGMGAGVGVDVQPLGEAVRIRAVGVHEGGDVECVAGGSWGRGGLEVDRQG